jgi:hypothetical protein
MTDSAILRIMCANETYKLMPTGIILNQKQNRRKQQGTKNTLKNRESEKKPPQNALSRSNPKNTQLLNPHM